MNKQNSKKSIVKFLPGIILCIVVMFIGIYGAELIGFLMINLGFLSPGTMTPVSSIFVAIIIGMIIRNTIKLNNFYLKGISFSTKYMLRIGIVLLGLRLSLIEALKLGVLGIPLIVLCISIGLFLTLYLTKLMNESHSLGTLIACGTGICGVTAIMTVSPVIKAKEDEVSYAVANITIFGLTAMVLYPFLANLVFADDPVKVGLFLGTAIHDTAQVAGAALIYDQLYDIEQVINVATITKLTRNLFIIVIIPFLSYRFYKHANKVESNDRVKINTLSKWYTYVPGFVIAFLIFVLLRTVGDFMLDNYGLAFGLMEREVWGNVHNTVSSIGTTYFLGIAMAGIGLSTDFSKFKGIGIKPFYIGFVAAVSIGIVSLTLISLFGHLIVV